MHASEVFDCTNKENGKYPHPEDNTKYITCSNGVTYVTDCPAGLRFDPESQTCDWPHLV
ncbi:Chitin binding Peritrophin-A domain-containing protein [Nocardia amikacinitolerans]|uniref:Chitin binding Peritrophin-A domain-containing protein n=1 Tax=Nocardia amikacinitolerans TaxID=756689 RepID=A0A285KXQ2_9NOCA|nr:Chitin binding Peritrophin-A domain-containing protein [Nocardia amikacinitolerans]MCP2294448.1 Chitin binding Peritrophin-A domain-containing protein [Nocardia amikacinitolerans]SNY77429.1 Chitin binding Peritrophin-A domain-containing protein [Nocardia amikacinitolerans]